MKRIERIFTDFLALKSNLFLSVPFVQSVFLLFLSVFPSFSQCNKPGFLTGDIVIRPRVVGCVPFSLTASSQGVTSRDPSWVFEYDGRDESKLTTNPGYTYVKPGVYTILQLSTVDGKPARFCATITVFDTIPPAIQFQSCGTSLTLSVVNSQSTSYQSYDINWGDGQPVQNVPAADIGAAVHQYANRQPYRVQVFGRYRVVTCGGRSARVFTPGEPPRPPIITRLEPEGQQIRVQVSNSDRGLYGLEQQLGTGDFRRIATGSRANTNQFTAPLDTAQINCFRLVQLDPCFPAANYPPICYEPPKPKPPVEPALSWWVPSAFTPNGDGRNDTFGVIGQSDPDYFQLSILNRWGVVVFRSTDPQKGWDGILGGQPAPAGPYAYHIQNGRSGTETSQKSGVVFLVR
jgi:gliding motility-associated-like protein